jgi:ParB family transcriptional regulator, chromosome partitioning protein
MRKMVADEKKRALGRGLNALFGDDEDDFQNLRSSNDGANFSSVEESDSTKNPLLRKVIGISQIVPGTYQPRHVFHNESIDELASSIREHGLLQPILVRPKPNSNGLYEIVAGERRWRAAQKAQLHEVPVVIRDLADDDTLEIALIENLQREDLNVVDEARALQQLVKEFSYSHDEIAQKLGKSRPYVVNILRLLDLCDDVMDMLRDEKISAGHARALLPLDEDQQIEQARKIIALGLNVRQTEKLVSEVKGVPIKHRMDKLKTAVEGKKEKDINTLALEREVSNILGMNVSIDMKDTQQGHMQIEFKSLDQLDEILHRLSHNPGRLALKG